MHEGQTIAGTTTSFSRNIDNTITTNNKNITRDPKTVDVSKKMLCCDTSAFHELPIEALYATVTYLSLLLASEFPRLSPLTSIASIISSMAFTKCAFLFNIEDFRTLKSSIKVPYPKPLLEFSTARIPKMVSNSEKYISQIQEIRDAFREIRRGNILMLEYIPLLFKREPQVLRKEIRKSYKLYRKILTLLTSLRLLPM